MNAKLARKPLLVWLAVMATGAASVTALQAQPMGEAHRMQIDGPMWHRGGPRVDHMVDRWLSGASNVTQAQRDEVRKIAEAARSDLRAQHETGRALHEQMRDLLAQPSIDADAIEALRQKMLAQHDQASRRMTQAMVDAARVLTPEQRAQAAAKAKARRDMMERHMRERRQLETPTGKG
ncbi:Spy/CpxP family protein refolding chaperone [Caldimonas sp. KR1-144]|uniref:Spy/CpxP family protein refolding chaperone n=1 Tax=Caldimonas sp. KR1-144 TaxID=3400911 RepID=UPI003C1148A7